MIDDKGGTGQLFFVLVLSEVLVPYWKLPKRAPVPLEFDINNNL